MRFLVVWCVVLGGVTGAGAQPAPDPKPQAKLLYDEGSKHYDLREYGEAVASFRKAYDLFPDPLFLFNIAQSYRQLQDCENALVFYKSYLSKEPSADNRDQIERFIATMDECVQKRETEREEARQREEARRREPPPIITHDDHTGLRLAGIITGAAGAVMIAGGIYFSLDARDQAREVESLCEEGCTTSDIAAIDRKGLDSERDAIVLYAIGGAAIAAGAGMFIAAKLKSRDTIVVAPTRNGVAAMMRF